MQYKNYLTVQKQKKTKIINTKTSSLQKPKPNPIFLKTFTPKLDYQNYLQKLIITRAKQTWKFNSIKQYTSSTINEILFLKLNKKNTLTVRDEIKASSTIYLILNWKIVGIININYNKQLNRKRITKLYKNNFNDISDFTYNSIFIANSRRIIGVTKNLTRPINVVTTLIPTKDELSYLYNSTIESTRNANQQIDKVKDEKSPYLIDTMRILVPFFFKLKYFAKYFKRSFKKYFNNSGSKKFTHLLNQLCLSTNLYIKMYDQQNTKYVDSFETNFKKTIKFLSKIQPRYVSFILKTVSDINTKPIRDVYKSRFFLTRVRVNSLRKLLTKVFHHNFFETLHHISKFKNTQLFNKYTYFERNTSDFSLKIKKITTKEESITNSDEAKEFWGHNMIFKKTNRLILNLHATTYLYSIFFKSIAVQNLLNLKDYQQVDSRAKNPSEPIYKLIFNFKKHYLYITVLDKRKNILFSLHTGLFMKFFNYKKSLKKSKSLKLLLIRYLRKLLLVTKINNFNFYIKQTSDQLNKLLQLLQKPTNHTFTDPLTNNIIDEENDKKNSTTFNFVYIVFLKNKPFGTMRKKNVGRLKRKIQRRLIKLNNIVD